VCCVTEDEIEGNQTSKYCCYSRYYGSKLVECEFADDWYLSFQMVRSKLQRDSERKYLDLFQ
jgi:hypothetical protein